MQTKLLHVQKAVYGLLSASTLLPALYDEVPEETAFPYLTIGEFTEERFDTMGIYGSEITFNLHVWSQYRGFKECYGYLTVIDGLLDYANITSTGFTNIFIRNEMVNTFIDPDGVTRHLVTRYRTVVQ